MRRAVITGLGPITAVGIGRDEFWDGLRAEKSGVQRVTAFDSSIFNAHCAAEIPDWAPEEFDVVAGIFFQFCSPDERAGIFQGIIKTLKPGDSCVTMYWDEKPLRAQIGR